MDIYTDSKSRWRPNSKSRHNGASQAKCARKCTICHPVRLAADKSFVAKDLDAEYTKSSGLVGRPAKEYVDWFFEAEEEESENVYGMGEEWGDWSAEEVGMVMGMRREEYERMVREHVEAERQLERVREMREGEKREEERRVEGEVVVEEEGDRDWDVVSTGSVDSIRLEDWEEVIVE